MGDRWRGPSADLPVSPTVKPLADALVDLGDRQARADRAVRRGLKSVADVEAYRARVRRNLWDVLGGEPQRTPLNARIVGTIARDGYRIEKVVFESRPRFYVAGALYVPTTGQPPYPAVLRPLGHYPHGKATYLRGGSEVQGHCAALARKGYAVFTFDPYGQGERGSYFDPSSGNNHFVQGTQAFLTGMHLGQHYLWDSVRALDYLLGRPEVDPDRVCLTGASGGGAQTLYHAALDERVAVAVPVCYVVESHRQIGRLGLHPESVFPGYAEPYGPNNTALAACVAPRPQLIVGARHDPEFPAESTRTVYEDVREVYRILGAEERLALVLADSGHGYTTPMRRAMYSWVNRWLRVEADDQEPDLVLESPGELLCTSGGDVAELGGETVFSLNRACARRLTAERAARRDEALTDFPAYRDAIRAGLTRSLLLHRPASALRATEIARARTALDRSETIRIEPEAGFEIALHLSVPRCARTPCPVVVHCSDEWSMARPALVASLLRSGFAFVAVETRLGGGYPALTFGRTGVGMAVTDLMRAIDLLAERPDLDARSVALYGEGSVSALVSLMAGVLDERVRAVAVRDPQRSLAELIDEPDRRSELHLLPGALRYYDVADLCAALAPRPQLLCHPDPDVEWPGRCYAALGRPAALRSDHWSGDEFDRLLVVWLAAQAGREALC